MGSCGDVSSAAEKIGMGGRVGLFFTRLLPGFGVSVKTCHARNSRECAADSFCSLSASFSFSIIASTRSISRASRSDCGVDCLPLAASASSLALRSRLACQLFAAFSRAFSGVKRKECGWSVMFINSILVSMGRCYSWANSPGDGGGGDCQSFCGCHSFHCQLSRIHICA